MPTKAHVPPQASGNTSAVKRAPDVIDQGGVRRQGRWSDGGMWVRGLCGDCNNLAGSLYDKAYADFARQVALMTSPFAKRMQIIRSEPPAVFFAPQLVAKCVLYGMFGIHPRLRVLFPELADDLVHQAEHIRWPGKVALKLGLTTPDLDHRGLLTSGVSMMKVLGRRLVHFPFAEIVFPPLVWALVPIDNTPELGADDTQYLTDASSWVRYSRDRTSVDLRSLTRNLPTFTHPMLSLERGSWTELHGEAGTDAEPVMVHGKLP
ncbi:hypothetical protein [Lentzea pudingi]|nr:hypothetical protein [Lentzea pudingi]